MRKLKSILFPCIIFVVIMFIVNNYAEAWPGTTSRVSVASDGTQSNNNSGSSFFLGIDISADGRYVVFQSLASNLVEDDTNGKQDCFVHDRTTNETKRISVSTNGSEANDGCYYPSISDDGRYIVFASNATNLIPDDTEGWWDVFMHDRVEETTVRISETTEGTGGNGDSDTASISGNGNFVVFTTLAFNLDTTDSNIHRDIVVSNLQTGSIQIVSKASDGTQANDHSYRPSISQDGSYISFNSAANNLVPDHTNNFSDVFIHNLQSGATTQVSRSTEGMIGNGPSDYGTISRNGRYAVFNSYATNLVSGDTNNKDDTFMHDLITGVTVRVSVASDGTQGNNRSYFGIASEEREVVFFSSRASNLVVGDNIGDDIFMYDINSHRTSLMSVSTEGIPGNGNSNGIELSGDGYLMVFTSYANNLVEGDTNGLADVFVRDTLESEYSLNVSVNPEGCGVIEIDPLQSTYLRGDEITFTATSNDGCSFQNWSGDATGTTNPLTIIVTGDINIIGNFLAEEYTLTASASPESSGSVIVDPLKPTYQYGEEITVTALANSGWSFHNWSGDASGATNPLTLIVTGNMSISANFIEVQYLQFLPAIYR